jgi:branched-chain amino acid transport system ATP-binding protein
LVEQNFHFARSLGRDMAVIEDGRVVHKGAMAEFAADSDLQNRLLGLAT